MAKYFKAKIDYLRVDKSNENGVSRKTDVIILSAIDYVDAQEKVVKEINNRGCCGEYDLEMQKVSYDYLLHKPSEKFSRLNLVKETQDNSIEEEELYWYEVKITRLVENEKGEQKYVTHKYLTQGTDLEDALDETRKDFSKDYVDEDYWWFSSIVETPITDVLEND